MANMDLKKQIIKVVENQLRMNKPQCTRKAFERLTANGASRQQAKEMIAAVLLEEMYDVLKYKKPFDEERYASKLSDLNDSMDGKENEYKNYSIRELLHLIEYDDGIFPEYALKEIIHKKDEAIPLLLDILKKVLENPKGVAENESCFTHIYAAYLLAQFRVIEAYPVYVEILKLPDELSHILFGDSLCEAGGRILASLCGNKLEPIKELIVSEQVDKYVRCQAIISLAILALHGLQPRDEIIEYYRTLLAGGIHDKNRFVMAEVVSSCRNIYPEEVMDEIRMAYQKELVDESFINLDFVETILSSEKNTVLEWYRNDPHHQLIHDTIYELRDWACFHEDYYSKDDIEDVELNAQTMVKEFKTGRNDPCPCGSGKKYKKCCGK